MSGAEVVPVAASTVTKAGRELLAEDVSTKALLARMSEDFPEMQAAALAYAKRVAVRQHIVLQIMRPLGRLAGFSKDYFENTFADEMAAKLSEVPEDQVQSPPPNVAVPAMQALGYSLDEPDLKDMYLNLLAHASDKQKAATTHPAFAAIIAQLSGAEAALLGQVLSAEVGLPIVKVKTEVPGSNGHQIVHHGLIELTNAITGEQSENESLETWLDNWGRLGLVERDFANFFSAEDRYAWTDVHAAVVRLQEAGHVVTFDKGVLRATKLGRQFATAVDSDKRVQLDRERWKRIADSLKAEREQSAQAAVSGRTGLLNDQGTDFYAA